jgi:hypothetical protein
MLILNGSHDDVIQHTLPLPYAHTYYSAQPLFMQFQLTASYHALGYFSRCIDDVLCGTYIN